MTQHKHGPLTLQGRSIIDENGQSVALVLMPQYGDVLARSTHLEVACKVALGWFENWIKSWSGCEQILLGDVDAHMEELRQMTFALRAALAPQIPTESGLREHLR